SRRRMMLKRMGKLGEAEKEMRPPSLYGPETADFTLICWDSTYGACKEAADEINEAGGSANVLHFSDLWPLPEEAVVTALRRCRHTGVVEQNYPAQLPRVLTMTQGIQ